jgi:hypothetical protein
MNWLLLAPCRVQRQLALEPGHLCCAHCGGAAWPAHQADDIGLLFIETGGAQAVSYVLQSDWIEVTHIRLTVARKHHEVSLENSYSGRISKKKHSGKKAVAM